MLGHVVVELTNKNCGRCYGLFLEVLTLLNSLVAMTCRSDQTEELMQTGRNLKIIIIIIEHQRLCGGAIYKFHYLHKFFKRSFYYFILIF